LLSIILKTTLICAAVILHKHKGIIINENF
jgi:hypothetical protein